MPYFVYDKSVKDVEYYEILEMLMERWEYEIVEFKEAKSNYDTDKIGRYFSAISNEANLRQQQYGWLVFGVSEKGKIVYIYLLLLLRALMKLLTILKIKDLMINIIRI